MTDNKEREAFEAWLSKHPDRGDFTSHEKDYMADAWQARALKSAPPQPAEIHEGSDDYMCPNCVTPWKCNGPHVLPAEQPSASPAALKTELIAALRWAIDEAQAKKLAGIAAPLSRILARAQGEQA